MTRLDWQQNAEERLQAADALLVVGLWSSAYYLAGYAVEAGLKSCVLVRVAAAPEVLFQKDGNKFSGRCWSHDIQDLVKLAGLESVLKADLASNAALKNNWAVVEKWTEASRYVTTSEADARKLFDAITDTVRGYPERKALAFTQQSTEA